METWINAYGIVSAAGASADPLWESLVNGKSHGPDCSFPPSLLSPSDNLVLTRLNHALNLALRDSGYRPHTACRLGVILASTKGINNDSVWSEEPATSDPLTPLLNSFLESAKLNPERRICVSNACSSSLGALALAELWLEQGLDQVLIVAADARTPFVTDGFSALKLLSENGPRPFDRFRVGFWLGEAAVCLWVSRKPSGFKVSRVGLDCEGSVVTRPETSSVSLARAFRQVPYERVGAILAHGTGTRINDATEAATFQMVFGDKENGPLITASKWCVGHTLGASAGVDLVLACEMLRHGRVFPIAPTHEPEYPGRFVLNGPAPLEKPSVLVSSLGFGGMHAAVVVEQ